MMIRMSTKITFAEWVSRVEATGRSKHQIARDLNIQTASLYRYLSGERTPSREVMLRIMSLSGERVDINCFFAARRSEPAA